MERKLIALWRARDEMEMNSLKEQKDLRNEKCKRVCRETKLRTKKFGVDDEDFDSLYICA